MKVLCVGNRGVDLPDATLKLSGNTEKAIFNITIGCEYVVYAMALWRSGIGILIIDDTERPMWKHIELFEIVDNGIPGGWEFGLVDGGEYRPVLALWGYAELIQNPDHHDDLINREKLALDKFFEEHKRRGQ